MKTIGFIGCGNMATSLINGLLTKQYSPAKLCASVRDAARAQTLQTQLGIKVSVNNHDVAQTAEVLVLAVKPQQMQVMARDIAAIVQVRKPLIISVAVGVSVAQLEEWLGGALAIVRSMPNTPALIGLGASGLFANLRVTSEQKNIAETIHQAVGMAVWVNEESLINAVASLSGSGPAYFFYLIEAMQHAGEQLGLDSETARQLALQTALGAGQLAMQAGETVEVLRRKVTSPKGTTEQAIKVFDEADLSGIVERAMRASSHRAEALTKEL